MIPGERKISTAVTELLRHPGTMVLGDCVIAVAAYLMAFLIRSLLPIPFTRELMPSDRLLQIKHYFWLFLALQPVFLFFLDTYHDIRFKRIRDIVWSVSGATGLQVLILVSAYFFTGNLSFPRTIFPIYWALNTAGVVGWRCLIRRSFRGSRRRVLIVGDGPLAERLIDELRESPEIGLEVVGIISNVLPQGESLGPYRVLGGRSEIATLVGTHRVEELILTPEEDSWKDRLIDSISNINSGVRISLVPSIYEILIGRLDHFNIRDIPLIKVVGKPFDPMGAFSRRLRDVLVSAGMIVLLSPLWLVIALAIKLSDRGPVLYIQNRVGRWGRPFPLIKFRTMPAGFEDTTGPVLVKADEPRLTPLGRFLRNSRIDETPQFINVLGGSMSLVGPRPDRPEFVEQFTKEIHGYNERHKVKPGITGLAQVRGYYHSDPGIKLKYDLAYIYNSSLMLDFKILLETVRIVFRRQAV